MEVMVTMERRRLGADLYMGSVKFHLVMVVTIFALSAVFQPICRVIRGSNAEYPESLFEGCICTTSRIEYQFRTLGGTLLCIKVKLGPRQETTCSTL